MLKDIFQKIRQAVRRIFGYKDIQAVEETETPLSTEMQNALSLWRSMYQNQAHWLGGDNQVKSLNLAALVTAELARQITLELKVSITGTEKDADGNVLSNPRSEYLAAEFESAIMRGLRLKLEHGGAAGGMAVKPYPKNGHLYCDWTMNWSLYPLAFDDGGELADVIFPESYVDGRTYYTRLERHRRDGDNVIVTQRAFKSSTPDSIGQEVPLESVPQWVDLAPELTIEAADGNLFGWYKTAAANQDDLESPMPASMYAKAVDTIKQADIQYSRLLWEYEGSELAVDIDVTCLRPGPDGNPTIPRLNNRLFRGVDVQAGGEADFYNVFSPAIRDNSLINGLNQMLIRVEDQCGLARGTFSDANVDARTATELKIVRSRNYETVHDNQKALEHCLRDVIRVMDKYATIYNLAPKGEYQVSFEWDDSIIIDEEAEARQDMSDLNAGIISKVEYRMRRFHETEAQATAAIQRVIEEKRAEEAALLPDIEKAGREAA